MRPLLALVLIAPLLGCGPVQATSALIAADVELEGARASGAATAATQEFVSAEAYLHKAREKNGSAQYEAATTFAEKSRELSQAARKKAMAASNARDSREDAP